MSIFQAAPTAELMSHDPHRMSPTDLVDWTEAVDYRGDLEPSLWDGHDPAPYEWACDQVDNLGDFL